MINWLRKIFSKKPPQIDHRIELLEKYPYSLKTVNQIYDATGNDNPFVRSDIKNRWGLVKSILSIANAFNKDPMVVWNDMNKRSLGLILEKGEEMDIYHFETGQILDLVLKTSDCPEIGQIIFEKWKVMKIERTQTKSINNASVLTVKIWVKNCMKEIMETSQQIQILNSTINALQKTQRNCSIASINSTESLVSILKKSIQNLENVLNYMHIIDREEKRK